MLWKIIFFGGRFVLHEISLRLKSGEHFVLRIIDKYNAFTEEEIKLLVVDKKWLTTVSSMVYSEMQQVTQQLTLEVVNVAERYEQTLANIDEKMKEYESKVVAHLKEMGFDL